MLYAKQIAFVRAIGLTMIYLVSLRGYWKQPEFRNWWFCKDVQSELIDQKAICRSFFKFKSCMFFVIRVSIG